MGTVSRGFRGRRRPAAELPPGQYLVEDFPVLSAGPTPCPHGLLSWSFLRSFHQAVLPPTRPHSTECLPNLSCLHPTGPI